MQTNYDVNIEERERERAREREMLKGSKRVDPLIIKQKIKLKDR